MMQDFAGRWDRRVVCEDDTSEMDTWIVAAAEYAMHDTSL